MLSNLDPNGSKAGSLGLQAALYKGWLTHSVDDWWHGRLFSLFFPPNIFSS